MTKAANEKSPEEKTRVNARIKARRAERMAEPVPSDLLVLDEAQAARALGLSVPTMQRLRREGRGPAWLQLTEKRIGYRRTTIDAWLERLEQM